MITHCVTATVARYQGWELCNSDTMPGNAQARNQQGSGIGLTIATKPSVGHSVEDLDVVVMDKPHGRRTLELQSSFIVIGSSSETPCSSLSLPIASVLFCNSLPKLSI